MSLTEGFNIATTYHLTLRQHWSNSVILTLCHQRSCEVVCWLCDVVSFPQRCHSIVCLLRYDKAKVDLQKNPNSVAISIYTCTMKTTHKHFAGWKKVGYIPRQISRYGYFCITQECGVLIGFHQNY